MQLFNEKQLENRVVELCTQYKHRSRFDNAEQLVRQYVECGYKVQYMYAIIDTYRLQEGRK